MLSVLQNIDKITVHSTFRFKCQYHTLHSIAYPYKISIQHELKPVDSPKRAEFCWWLLHYAHSDVSYILLQWWSLVPFRWLHKHEKLSCWEFEKPSHFSNNVVASTKNWFWCTMNCKYVLKPILFETITAEVYHDIIEQFIVLLHKDGSNAGFQQDNARPHVAKDTMSFLTEFFWE